MCCSIQPAKLLKKIDIRKYFLLLPILYRFTKGKNADFAPSGGCECIHHGPDGRARCHHVVYQQDMLSIQFLRMIDGEGIRYVRLSLVLLQSCLIGSVSQSVYVLERVSRYARCPRDAAGNKLRLVVPSLPQSPGVKRHRDNQVDSLEEIGLQIFVCRLPAQVLGEFGLMTVFEAMYQLLHPGSFLEEQVRSTPLKSAIIAE